mgnify:FL=1
MHDIEAMAERLFPDTGFISEEMRQAHILKWKEAVAFLGSRWLAVRR